MPYINIQREETKRKTSFCNSLFFLLYVLMEKKIEGKEKLPSSIDERG